MFLRAKVAAVALGAMLSLSACSFTANVASSEQYDPSDGTGALVGDVRVQNFLLVTTGEGEPAALIGSLYNDGDATANVSITVGSTEQTFRVEPMETVQLGMGEDAEAFIATAPANPGRTDSYTIAVVDTAAYTGTLAIVDGTLPEYRPVLAELAAVSQ